MFVVFVLWLMTCFSVLFCFHHNAHVDYWLPLTNFIYVIFTSFDEFLSHVMLWYFEIGTVIMMPQLQNLLFPLLLSRLVCPCLFSLLFVFNFFRSNSHHVSSFIDFIYPYVLVFSTRVSWPSRIYGRLLFCSIVSLPFDQFGRFLYQRGTYIKNCQVFREALCQWWIQLFDGKSLKHWW